MEDIAWLRALLNRFEETIWYMNQTSSELVDFRKDIKARWADHAARQINDRYLDPHDENDRKMLDFLRMHHSKLSQVKDHIERAYEYTVQFNELSLDMEEMLNGINQEIGRARENHDAFRINRKEASDRLAIVYELIQKADSACG